MTETMRTVLVVDDDAAVRSLAARILRRAGYAVMEAVDGAQALVRARGSGGVALLLTDVVLPGQNGAELAEALRVDHPDMAVVFMSGFEESELEARGIGGVGAAYVTKPFTADVLALVARGALQA